MPAFFCGLIDDVLQALLSRSCPSYFLPQINLLDKSDDATILSLGRLHSKVLKFQFLPSPNYSDGQIRSS